MKKFRYSAYWRTWSLVLATAADGKVTELDLVPTSAGSGPDWDRTAEGRVRSHRTPVARGDIVTDTLPADVRALMVENMGEGATAWLLS